VAVVALNTPVDESNLQRLSDDELAGAIGPGVVLVERDGDWSRAVFRTRQGPELGWPLLLATVALMLVEVLLAAAGRVEASTNKRGKPRNSPMPNATV
jgi:hypothetical protein